MHTHKTLPGLSSSVSSLPFVRPHVMPGAYKKEEQRNCLLAEAQAKSALRGT